MKAFYGIWCNNGTCGFWIDVAANKAEAIRIVNRRNAENDGAVYSYEALFGNYEQFVIDNGIK